MIRPIHFTLEQVICGFLAVGAPSDTWTVATNSLPDEIKYLVQLIWIWTTHLALTMSGKVVTDQGRHLNVVVSRLISKKE